MSEILECCKSCTFYKDETCKGTESIGDIGYSEEDCDEQGYPPCWEPEDEVTDATDEYELDEDEDDE